MDYVLVPRQPTSTTAKVTIVAFGDPRTEDPERHRVTLAMGGDVQRIDRWERVFEDEGAWCAQASVTPGPQRRTVELSVDGKRTDSAEVVALPERLEASPLRVVLGSCFEPTRFGRERLKRAIDNLEVRPSIKLLCGDQVYLDPILLTRLWKKASHAARTVSIYRATWTHPGFGALLKSGMNVFCPDDHDLWNDYTVEDGGADKEREEAAKRAIQVFQCDTPWQQFEVSPLRFMVVDTRQRRTLPEAKDKPQFVDEDVLDEVVAWVSSNRGPGVLVLGQPIFGEHGYHGKFGSDIPQYSRQFKRLAQALLAAPRSILVLSGDVHWGRVAHATNRNEQRLIEVISSPLGINPLRAASTPLRPWRPALPEFSDGSTACKVETVAASELTGAHFVTLDFRADSSAPNGVSVEIQQRLLKQREGEGERPSFPYPL